VFVPATICLIFAGKAKSLPLQYNTQKGSTLVGASLACKIRLGWKWMAVKNTLAYYDTATIMAV
jgi:hypothetical protein